MKLNVNSPKKAIKFVGSFGVTIALLALVHFWLGWDKLLQPWKALEAWQVLSALGLLFITYLLRAIRITHFFKLSGSQNFWLSARIMILHNFWNNLLPMRSGEISFPILMQSHLQVPLSQSLPALMWFRLLDLQVLAVIGLIALSSLWLEVNWVLIAGIIASLLPFLVYFLNRHWLKPKLNEQSTSWLSKLVNGMPTSLSQVFWSWFWTLLNWGLKILVLIWVFSWLYQAAFGHLAMGVIGGELSSVLPIHGVAGFGSYEAGIMLGLSGVQYNTESLLVAAINLHLILLISSFLAAAVMLLVRLKPLKH